MKEMGCLSPFESNWVRTAPVAYFDASVLIWNGLVWCHYQLLLPCFLTIRIHRVKVLSGIINAGSSVNRFFSSSKAFGHLVIHSNF